MKNLSHFFSSAKVSFLREGVASWRTSVALLLFVVALGESGCGPSQVQAPPLNTAQAEELRKQLRQGGGAAAQEDEVAATGTGWATLAGSFRLDPAAPLRTPKALSVSRDVEVCGVGGHAPMDQLLIVDPANRGIANVAIYARKVSRVNESAQGDNASILFDQKQCVFLSHVLGVRLGQTLKVANSDPIGHNTNIAATKSAAFNQTIASGGQGEYKPTGEEAFPIPVTCNIHPWMKAYLLPRATGYFAVTKPDGSFEIPNLPAGEELEFQVWHESATGAGGGLSVQRPDLKWTNKGRFKIKLNENERRELEIIVPGNSFSG